MSVIEEKALESPPDFYRNLSGDPYTGRLDGNLDVKSKLNNANEIIEYQGICNNTDIYFTGNYKKRPLIRGIKHQNESGYNLFLPSDFLIEVFPNRIRILSNIITPNDYIDYLKFRVYSLDNDNNAISYTA